jgi:hypothetical protein
MKLHVLTAVTRPENLPRLAASLTVAAPPVEILWHWRFDPECGHIGGHALKNAMLDEIADGWCWILDDDTVAHPLLFERLVEVIDSETEAVVVNQERADGRYLVARPEDVRPGWIDVGQAIIRRDLIGEHRMPLNDLGDGLLLEEILLSCENVVYLNETLSYHNALSEHVDGENVESAASGAPSRLAWLARFRRLGRSENQGT